MVIISVNSWTGNPGNFRKNFRSRNSDEKIEEIIDDIEKAELTKYSLEEIITTTINYLRIDIKELESGKCTKKVNEARKIIVLLAKKLTDESNKSIGIALGLSESGVSKILSRENIDDEIQEIKEKIVCQVVKPDPNPLYDPNPLLIPFRKKKVKWIDEIH